MLGIYSMFASIYEVEKSIYNYKLSKAQKPSSHIISILLSNESEITINY